MTTGEDETRRLREQVARLEQEVARSRSEAHDRPGGGPRSGWWRPASVVVLLLVVALTAPAAVVATWARDVVRDTDRYVETVAPLADDPAVQDAMADRITLEIVERLDVQAVTDEAVAALEAQGLPPGVAANLSALTGPLVTGVEDFVNRQALRLVSSEQFAAAWLEANRVAHDQLVAVLVGGGDSVTVSGNRVSISLAAIIESVKQLLLDRGLTLVERLPTVQAEFTIFESQSVEQAQQALRLLDAAARVLPLVALLALGVAVAVGRSSRRTLVAGAIVVVASMLALGLGLNVVRELYLGAVPTDQLPTDAAAAIFDAVVRFVRTSLRALAVLFLAVAVASWLAGPSSGAVSLRSASAGAAARLRTSAVGDREPGPVAATLWAARTPIRVGIVLAVLLAYVMTDHPTGATVLWSLVAAVVALLAVGLVAQPATSPSVGDGDHVDDPHAHL